MRRSAALVVASILSLAVPVGSALAADAAVDVQDNAFAPAEVTVTAGDTVTWTQTGVNPHSVTADDGSFDSHPSCDPGTGMGCMQQGDTFQHTFDQPGTFGYYCKVHGGPGGAGMSGTVEAEGGGNGGGGGGSEPLTVPSPEETPLAETGGSPVLLLGLGGALLGLGISAAGFLRRGRGRP